MEVDQEKDDMEISLSAHTKMQRTCEEGMKIQGPGSHKKATNKF